MKPQGKRFVMQRRVEFADTDQAGIVHFAAFFKYMETAEHELFRSAGLSIVSTDERIGWPRVSCDFEFFKPLRFPDEFEVQLGVVRLGRTSVTYEATIVRQSEVLARGHSTSACCKISPTGLSARSVPDHVVQTLREFLLTGTKPEQHGQ